MAFVSGQELIDLVIMTVGVGYIFTGLLPIPRKAHELPSFKTDFLYSTLIAAPAVIFHEAAHKIVAMLNSVDKATEERLLKDLEDRDPELAASVREMMFTFDDLANLDNRSMQVLIKTVPQEKWKVALRKVKESVTTLIFKNMSERAAKLLQEDIAAARPLKLAEVEAAQAEIAATARRLAEEGEIIINNSKEQLPLFFMNGLCALGPLSCSVHGSSNFRQIRFIRRAYIKDHRDIAGTLAEQIETGVHFVLKNIRLRGTIEGTKRVEKYEYPEKIIREMIVNAVIHRDYSISGECIMLAIYDDRLTVTTPGGLAGPVTVNNIADRQFNRNPIIAKRMFEMGYFESWGQGIDLILNWAKTKSRALPEFADDSSSFTITIYPERTLADSEFDENFDRVLGLMADHGKITNRLVREKLKLSKTQAQVLLRQMTERGLIVGKGHGRSVHYVQV